MFVVPTGGFNIERFAQLLWNRYLPKSRFTLRIDYEDVRYRRQRYRAIRLRNIRLRTKKFYCGQHAGPCPIRPFGGEKKHTKSRYLEGADWVGFDDMLNDILDRHRMEATIWSAGLEFKEKFFVRLHQQRRTIYPAHWERQFDTDFMVWDCAVDAGGFTAKHFGTTRDVQRSEYPEGTPGIAEWRLSKSRKLERLLATHHEDH